MTTTTDKMRARVIGLVAKARATDYAPERATYMEKAEELITRYSLPRSLLTDPTPQAPSAARAGRPSYTQPERKYPCRFGCGTFTQHTIDEMNACAERRRNATGSDTAYDIPTNHDPNRRGTSFFDEFFGGSSAYAGRGWTGQGHSEHASWTRPGGARTGSESFTDEPKPKRRQTSHANCDHEATKAARAHCRKMRAAGYGF